MAGNLNIAFPEDDAAFAALREQQQQAHDEIARNSEIVQKYKAHINAVSSVFAPRRPDPTTEETERAREASRNVRAARVKLRDLELPLREARSKAARQIADQARPEYLARLGAYAAAYLKSHEAELVALEEIFALRGELEARAVPLGTFPIVPFERKFENVSWRRQVVREDALELVRLGALKPADVPSALRKYWGLA
ncbi:hypothetical protein H0I76_15680 [Limibaculum sp. M0105]|uniref:Uncharacterized protein n=1 Tax=Thermohalobaculum xanthum TaxID=2753746 RepID=A0A8J7M8N3_9RHOB|nr:hypothetical protein [Thermohalobaculum xanthum]MBK0400639.1 hypothetical protein [Thermohalobaculum xanthum]